MEPISEGQRVIDFFSDENSLISAELFKIELYKSADNVTIYLHINLVYAARKKIVLRFEEVKEFCFYYNEKHIFYNIASYKLFNKENNFYISLDPADEKMEVISGEDQDFVVSKKIKAFWVD
jgi:hypothetical protein